MMILRNIGEKDVVLLEEIKKRYKKNIDIENYHYTEFNKNVDTESVIYLVDKEHTSKINDMLNTYDTSYYLNIFRFKRTHYNIYSIYKMKKGKMMFLNKKSNVEKGIKLLMDIGYKKINVSLITKKEKGKKDIEANIIRLFLSEELKCNSIDEIAVDELLDINNVNSIYNNINNLIVFNSSEEHNFFYNVVSKLACDYSGSIINNGNNFYIFTESLKYNDIYFIINSIIERGKMIVGNYSKIIEKWKSM